MNSKAFVFTQSEFQSLLEKLLKETREELYRLLPLLNQEKGKESAPQQELFEGICKLFGKVKEQSSFLHHEKLRVFAEAVEALIYLHYENKLPENVSTTEVLCCALNKFGNFLLSYPNQDRGNEVIDEITKYSMPDSYYCNFSHRCHLGSCGYFLGRLRL